MPIAADYPFLDVFWSMIIFFVWVIWIWMMIMILTDVFRRHDLSGWGKAAWTVFLIILPFLGALIYLIAKHDGMARARARMCRPSGRSSTTRQVGGRQRRRGRRDRQGQAAARQRRDQPGGVRGAQGQGLA